MLFTLITIPSISKGKFSLSYYEFDLLSKWLPKDKFIWESKDFVKAASAQKGITQNKGTELLVMNYERESSTGTNESAMNKL